MIPIERLTPEQLAERYRRRAEMFREPDPLVVSPQLYAEIEREIVTHGRRAKRKAFEKAEAQWCTHLGPVPTPNRHERRRMAALKRRAKR